MSGFEWPAPYETPCGAIAEDRLTGNRISCLLRKGHRAHEHHWVLLRGGELLSASWIARGHITFIGEPLSAKYEPHPLKGRRL
jgi:hypothetical protein